MKTKNYKCFRGIANVIGKKAAKCELKAVVHSGVDISRDYKLHAAFDWGRSPQGFNFWENIDDGIYPAELLKCFSEVETVLGTVEAVRHLSKVEELLTEESLIASFCWSGTPQGYDFWRSVHNIAIILTSEVTVDTQGKNA